MAIYKAEDIAVSIDGTELCATTLSFQTSAPIAEDRRLGKQIQGKDFLISGPQRSSLNVSFYLTGTATGDNPIFSLIKGDDAYDVDFLSGITGFEEAVGKKFRARWDAENSVQLYEYMGDYYVYALRYDSIGDRILIWKGENPSGYWLTGSSVFGTGEYGTYEAFLTEDLDEFYASGGNLFSVGITQSGTGRLTRVGAWGITTGSSISLGGVEFANGAALTSLSFTMSPFAPVICSASFDIYNEVTGTFTTGGASISIGPTSTAHGMFSYYSGITGISEVSSVSWDLTLNRVPRYVVGKKNVHEIKTTSARKTVAFQGWGSSTPVLEDAPNSFAVVLGSQAGIVFADTVSGYMEDNSFELPNVGLMSKNFTIVENIL